MAYFNPLRHGPLDRDVERYGPLHILDSHNQEYLKFNRMGFQNLRYA